MFYTRIFNQNDSKHLKNSNLERVRPVGLDEKRKEKLVPRYKPVSEVRVADQSKVFNDEYLQHHSIMALKWRPKQNKKQDGETDD